jgi:hypothetical protein
MVFVDHKKDISKKERFSRVLLVCVAVVGVVLFVMHSVAQGVFLYWTYRWFDIPMHFLGGVWVGLLSAYVLLHTAHGKKYAPQWLQRPVYAVLVGTLMLGVAWEAYEIFFKFFNWGWFPDAYALDTLLDIVMDMLGGVVAWRWYVLLEKYFGEKRVEK